jgi:hypothetical protein
MARHYHWYVLLNQDLSYCPVSHDPVFGMEGYASTCTKTLFIENGNLLTIQSLKGMFVAFGGVLFGYDTGTFSGILAMRYAAHSPHLPWRC